MWRNIYINENLIKAQTERAVLICLPRSSALSGFSFWHPTKLVRGGFNGQALHIRCTNEFIFHLRKYGKGKYNSHEIIEEREVTAADIAGAFSCIGPNDFEFEEQPFYTPVSLEAEGAEADVSLIDNG